MNDIQLQIRSLVPKMAIMAMEKYGWDMKRALDELYASETFKAICNPRLGLYYQGAVYNFEFFENEVETGKMQ